MKRFERSRAKACVNFGGRVLDVGILSSLYEARIERGQITQLRVGDQIAELLGYPAQTIESDVNILIDITHPNDHDRVSNALSQLLQGQSFSLQYRIFREDGQMQWVQHSATPVLDAQGQVKQVVGLIFAVSPQPAIEFLPQVLNDISIPVSIRDISGSLTYCNQSYADICGYPSPESMIGTGFDEIFSSDCLAYFNEQILPQILMGPFTGELELTRKDGSTMQLRASSNVLRDEIGEPIGIYAIFDDISDIKNMQKALLSSESLLRQFVENMPAAVAMFDKEMRYMLASKRWLSDYGLGDIDIIGRVHYDVFPEAPGRWKEDHQRVLHGEVISSDEDLFTRLDGRPEWLRWELRPWRDQNNEIGGLIMYTEVITERKLAEQALRRSEQLLKTIQNSIPAEIAVLDKNGVIIAVNEAWEKFAREHGDPGLEHTGIGVNYFDVCRNATGRYSQGAQEALDGLTKLMNGEISEFQQEYECPTLEHRCWFSMRAAPLLGEQGGLVVSHFDMTDAMQAQEAMLASEEKYRTLVENMDAIVFRMDPQMKPITLAGNVEKMTHLTTDDILAHPEKWFGAVDTRDIKRVLDFFNEMIIDRKSNSIDFRVRLLHSEIRWMRAHVKPHFNLEADLVYYDGVIVDITEKMEAVEREQRHTARLAALADVSQHASSFDTHAISCQAVTMASKAASCLCFIHYINHSANSIDSEPFIAGDEELKIRLQYAFEHTSLTADAIFGKHGLKPLLNQNLDKSYPVARQLAQETGSGPNLWVPLYSEGVFCGIIAAFRKSDAERFDDEDLWLFAEIASVLSASLTNSALFRRQARIAETLQRSLIPMSPDVEVLDIATCYFPAVGEAEVGGDFFDIIDFGDGRIGVVVGDVSGKGIEAAIHTAESKYMLRGYALQNSDPGFVITALNRALCAFTGEYTFVTLAYLLIDIPGHQAKFVNAGHEPPLILCRDLGEVHELYPTGPVLGIKDDFCYVSDLAELNSDDLLFGYTDGVTDVPLDGERYGYDRLVDTVKKSQPKSAQQLLDIALKDVRDYGHGTQPDDQVIVVIGPKA